MNWPSIRRYRARVVHAALHDWQARCTCSNGTAIIYSSPRGGITRIAPPEASQQDRSMAKNIKAKHFVTCDRRDGGAVMANEW